MKAKGERVEWRKKECRISKQPNRLSPCPFAFRLPSHHPLVCEAEMSVASHHNVVKQRNLHQLTRFF